MDKTQSNSQDVEVRKGPWTLEEDLILTNHIANHGEGVWNSLARSADRSLSVHDEKDTESNVGCSMIRRSLGTSVFNEPTLNLVDMENHQINQQPNVKKTQGSETNEHGSSSTQVSSTTELIMTNSLPAYHGDVEAFSGESIPQELNENYWSMEDLWSMQLLNGD
ncbi:hypothetical protein SADUNF_Sadunf17G0066500 [Salix dunnii]|uniref:Myb-like domain-containing protein n=1 Tax=Salix dunnii TaxID=1413687 RepID=A0A835J5S0_9ROSI|nr:hypothetical protein SADUNF_Sadunf17G0066500 [Salix dunnii]